MLEKLPFDLATVDFVELSREVFGELEEIFRKRDECEREGHRNSRVTGYDYTRLRADCVCSDCGVMYDRAMNSQEMHQWYIDMNSPFTI